MGRIALALFLVLAALLVLRALRLWLAAIFPARSRPGTAIDGEMVRDPVCGTWIDRRLAMAARSGEEWVPVCSEECRARASAPPAAPTRTRAGEAGANGP